MTVRITGLYAVCDLESRARGGAGIDLSVREFARLSDGPPVLLRELGWTATPSTGDAATVDAYLTEERIVADVRTVVLPDDAETSHEEHPWELLAAVLTGKGVPTTAAGLRGLPYEVIIAPRLRERLS